MGWIYETLFDVDREHLRDSLLMTTVDPLIKVGQMGYRTMTVKAGPRLEAIVYPVWGKSQEQKARVAKQNETPMKQQTYNLERSRRYLVRLADANFTEKDIHLTLTYKKEPEPDQERKDIRAFLERVKRRRKKEGLPELKYIYAIEGEDGKTRKHIHILMSGGLDRIELEKIWGKGYANADRLQPEKEGLEAIARYISKQQKRSGKHKWSGSKNLIKPTVTRSDTKLSNRKIKTLAEGFEYSAKEIMEKVYPGYDFVNAGVKFSDIVDGVYIRVLMRRTGQ